MTQGFKAALISAPPAFTEVFTTSDLPITAAGALTVAHGFTGIPTFVDIKAVCGAGQYNYSVGDVLEASGMVCVNSVGASGGVSIVCDETNINIRFGSNGAIFVAPNKITGISSGLWNLFWKMRVTVAR